MNLPFSYSVSLRENRITYISAPRILEISPRFFMTFFSAWIDDLEYPEPRLREPKLLIASARIFPRFTKTARWRLPLCLSRIETVRGSSKNFWNMDVCVKWALLSGNIELYNWGGLLYTWWAYFNF